MNSAENYYKRSPEKQLFYKWFALAATFFGLGSYKWWQCEVSKPVKYVLNTNYCIVLVTAPICVISEIVYVYTRYNEIDFAIHGNIFTIIPATILGVVKIISAQLPAYKNFMKRFMKHVHLYNFQNQDPFVIEKSIEAEYNTRRLIYFFLTFLVIDWALWALLPVIISFQHIEEIRNKTRPYQTCVYVWMPFDYEYNFTNWLIVHSLSSCIVCLGCGIITILDTLNYSIIFHLIGHIKILKYKLKMKITDNLSDEEMAKNLSEIIAYHCFILQVFGDVENAFGVNVTSNYFYNLFADSLMLYHLMAGETENKLIYGFMLFVYMGGLILMTFVLEEVRRQTGNISEIVYSLPWEKMSLANQKTFLILLGRTQPTLEFVAAGGLRAGVKPTINIIKSTFSYYVMLNSSL